MSLKAKIQSAVDKAFSAVGDLVVLAVLSSKEVTGYNFITGEVDSSPSTLTVEVILQTTSKPSGVAFQSTVILKSGFDVSIYDTLEIAGKSYNITDYTDDGFIITLTLVREVS